MSLNPSVLESLSLEQAIERDPLTVSPDRPIVEVVALMSEVRDGTCTLENEWEKTLSAGFPLEGEIATGNTYILVVEGARLVGIVTESDLVKLASRAIPLAQLTVADVMSADPVVLEWSERRNLFDIVQLFRQHAITHVPIVDGRSQLLGVVTAAQIRRVLQPSNLLRFQEVRDVMNPEVICAPKTTSIRKIAELMVRRRIGCVTIAEEQNGHLIPLGIVTQRDVIQFQSLELDLESLSAQTVMSAPAIAVSPHDSLWDAHQIMLERRIRRLLVVGTSGELLGIVTQTRLLQVLDPVQMYRVIEVLHEQVLHLEAQKVELLRDRAADLEEKVRQRTSKLRDRVRREALLAGVASRIRESLNLQEILDSTAREVRRFLDCNRVLVYQFAPNMEGEIVAESVSEGYRSILGEQIRDTYFQTNGSLEYLNGRKRSVNDIYQAGLTGCHVELLEQFQVRSFLVIPIIMEPRRKKFKHGEAIAAESIGRHLWGLLVAHQCDEPRNWYAEELNLLERVGVQLAIAIQQAQLFQQLQAQLQARQRAEEQLAYNERLLSLFYKTAPIGLALADEQGRFVRVNPAFCYLFGYPEGELVGRHYTELLDLETPGEWEIRRHDGRVFHIYLTGGWASTDRGQRYLVTTITDITERKQTERAIAETAQQLSTVLETVGEGIALSDTKGYFLLFNSKMQEITGYTADEANRCENFLALIYPEPEEYQRALSRLSQLLNLREFRNIETTIRAKDGTRRTLLVSSSIVNHQGRELFLSAYRDISDRKQAEIALRESEKRYRQIVETSMEGIWTLDEGDRTSFVNQRMASMLGYDSEDMLGAPLEVFVYKQDCEMVKQYLEWRRQGISAQHEFQFRRQDGSSFYGLVSANPLFDDAGNYTGVLAMITDITERRQAEAAVQQLNAELEARVNLRTAELADTIEQLRQEVQRREGSENALRKSEELYRTLIANFPNGAVILYDRDLRYTICDGSGLQDIGFSGEALQGKTIWELFPPDLCAILEPHYRAALVGESRTFEVGYGNKLLLLQSLPVTNDRGEIFAGMVLAQDITERKQAEIALRKSEERFALAVEGIKDGIWDWDIESGHLYLSPRWKSMLGFADDEVPHRIESWQQTLHPDDYERAITTLDDYLTGKSSTYEQEFRARHKDGHYRWILARGAALRDDRGKPYRMAGSHTDITERKQAEVQLQRQLAAIEAASDGIAILNSDGQFIYLNHAHVGFFGFDSARDILGQTWRALYDDSEIERFETEILPVLRREGHWQGQAIARRQDGSTFVEDLSFTQLADGGCICVCRDISEMMRTLSELKQTEEKLKASLNEKELLLKEVHHRVKNNLQIISSIFSLQSQSLEDEKILAILQDSQARIASMALIHEKLYQSKNIAQIDFAEYIKNLTTNLFSSYNIGNRQIALDLDVEKLSLNLDTAIPCGLLINELVSNALKHAFRDREVGQIKIEFSILPPDRLRLIVRDNGVGLPSNFDSRTGYSLGFRLIRALSRQLKGNLEIDRTQGTCFTVTFPQPTERKRF